MDQFVAKLADNNKSSGATSYRHIVEYEVQHVSRHTRTGYAQYLTLTNDGHLLAGHIKPAKRHHLAALRDQHSHTPERIIGVIALSKSYDQHQAIVQWGPCIQPAWQIRLQQIDGYKVRQERPATTRDLQEFGLDTWRPCEYCASPATLGAEHTRQCTLCARAYHVGCIEKVETRSSDRHPYTCAECLSRGYTTQTLPTDIVLHRIEWEEHQEAIDTVHQWATDEALQQLEERQTAQLLQAGRPPKEPRLADTSRTAVMPDKGEMVYDITIGDPLRKKLIIHPTPFNPHVDVAPLGCRKAYIRQVAHLNAKDQLTSSAQCCVYNEDGTCAHMI